MRREHDVAYELATEYKLCEVVGYSSGIVEAKNVCYDRCVAGFFENIGTTTQRL